MRLKNKIQRVNGFDVKTKELIWQSQILYCDGNIIYEDDILEFYAYKNVVIVINSEGITYINLDNNTRKKIEIVFGVNSFINETEIIYGYPNENYSGSYVSKFNLETEEFVWIKDAFFIKTFFKNNFHFVGGSSIYKLNTDNGNAPWQFDLSQFGTYPFRSEGERPYEVQKFIGVMDNVLWVEISDSNLLALNVDTGHLNRRMNCRSMVPEEIGVQGGPNSYMLDEKNRRIVWLSNTALFYINLQNGEIEVIKDFWNVDLPDRWYFGGMTLYEDKIYFSGAKGKGNTFFKTWIGVMDAETGTVLWHEKIDLPDSKSLGIPQVSKDKLYVLATNGDLYIYEKE